MRTNEEKVREAIKRLKEEKKVMAAKRLEDAISDGIIIVEPERGIIDQQIVFILMLKEVTCISTSNKHMFKLR